MQRDKAYFFDLCDSIQKIVDYTKNVSFEEFAKDTVLQDAVIRRFEILGEAANRISDESKRKYSQVPWKNMTGMRNFIIHEYDVVDVKIVWDTVMKDLPSLALALKEVMKNFDQ